MTTFSDVLGLPDHNFQTALGKAIEYEKLGLLEDFGKPDEIRGTVFQWVSYHEHTKKIFKSIFQVISSSEERSKREKVNELGQIYRFIGKLYSLCRANY